MLRLSLLILVVGEFPAVMQSSQGLEFLRLAQGFRCPGPLLRRGPGRANHQVDQWPDEGHKQKTISQIARTTRLAS